MIWDGAPTIYDRLGQPVLVPVFDVFMLWACFVIGFLLVLYAWRIERRRSRLLRRQRDLCRAELVELRAMRRRLDAGPPITIRTAKIRSDNRPGWASTPDPVYRHWSGDLP